MADKTVKMHLGAGPDIYAPGDPNTRLRYKTHGIHYFMPGVSNQFERAVAIHRAIGKDNNGDISKWMQSKKGVDRGEAWRVMKNLSRFVKNPLGYLYWKTTGLFDSGRIRIHHLMLLFIFYMNYDIIAQTKLAPNYYINKMYARIGLKNLPTQDPVREYSRGSDTQGLIVMETAEEKCSNNIHLNYQCRDQNYRKYLAMRAKKDILPPNYSL
eukprot:CAMPEP_0115003836 /NCGR_PEP_ID=MMETSP0216-20121206/18852_1 /TAXON_ID=223996 /ORGANISM="Protocruzia adherens, Strain Boccale" /LENGTH=211 /DNA_ID=CAMNT_0002369725 /DNA_START=30 /DNA_END=665 /DNA_ORIENTATION=-